MKLDLLIETELLTPSLIADLCVAREQLELICDRCQDPDELLLQRCRFWLWKKRLRSALAARENYHVVIT